MNLFDKTVLLENDAAAFGFKWETTDQIFEQIFSECAEINEHLNGNVNPPNSTELQLEVGDLLHAVLSLCVFCQFNPQETLTLSLDKFERRLTAVKCISEAKGLIHLKGQPFDELMTIWREAKEKVG